MRLTVRLRLTITNERDQSAEDETEHPAVEANGAGVFERADPRTYIGFTEPYWPDDKERQ